MSSGDNGALRWRSSPASCIRTAWRRLSSSRTGR